MPPTEIYIKLITGFPKDPKVRALIRYGDDAGLARDLYVQMCLYCRDMLSDGFVPAEEVGVLAYPLSLDRANQLANQLASVGLTKEVSKDEASGWQVCAFLKRNPSKERVHELSDVRAKAGQTGGRKSRKRPAQRASQANSKQVANQVGQQTGSNPVSVSVPETETIQTPTVSAAGAANGLTPTQRSKPITDAYAQAQPMCRWPAINGVVIHAIKSGKYTDDEIRVALLRMAESGQSVTVEKLRIEIEGFTPTHPRASPAASTTDTRVGAGLDLAAKYEAQEARELPP